MIEEFRSYINYRTRAITMNWTSTQNWRKKGKNIWIADEAKTASSERLSCRRWSAKIWGGILLFLSDEGKTLLVLQAGWKISTRTYAVQHFLSKAAITEINNGWQEHAARRRRSYNNGRWERTNLKCLTLFSMTLRLKLLKMSSARARVPSWLRRKHRGEKLEPSTFSKN